MHKPFKVTVPEFPYKDFNICSFGAKSGGRTSNSEAFRAAIEAAARQGGRVIVPDGLWLTGPIRLLSNVELHLEDNAVVLFEKNPEEYPLIVTDYEGIARIRARSPIFAEQAENIAITGKGVFDGNGHLWRPVKEFKTTQRQWKELLQRSPYVIEGNEGGVWVPTKSIYEARFAGEVFPGDYPTEEEALKAAAPYYDFYRPVMVSLRHCRNILIEDVHLQNSAAWCVHPYFCEHFTMRGVQINNPYYAQNGDGVDVDSCRFVHIHHCDFHTGDDAICLKAGKDRESRKLKKPCEDVYIHDCKTGHCHGGFVIGSEMSRGVRNVLVENCSFIDSDVGICFKSAMGRGGIVENICLKNIQMLNIKKECVSISMDYVHNQMDYFDPVVQSSDPEDIPLFRKIELTNCVCPDPDVRIKIKPLDGYPDSIRELHMEGWMQTTLEVI